MNEVPERWGLVFPGPTGAHGEQEVVVVRRHGSEIGPHGDAVYTGGDGVRAEITADGVVYLLDSDGLPDPQTPPYAVRLP